MNETITKITAWIKTHTLIAALIGVMGLLLFTNRKIKRLIFGAPRRRRRRSVIKTRTRKTSYRRARSKRPLPRSVGTRTSGKGYAAAGGGSIPFKYNKDGTIKKAWQVSGTLAAKQRMARLRRNR